MFEFIKKIANYILTGSFTMVFAACYGTDMALENPKLINTSDNNQNPIPGLKVTLFENQNPVDQKFTDDAGSAEFYLVQHEQSVYKAKIEDVDGVENLGEFQSKEIDVSKDSFFKLNLENKE